MKPGAGVIIRVRRQCSAAAERVFDAWLDAKSAEGFLFATPEGVMLSVKIDARVGGSFQVTERRNGISVVHNGIYLEIARPRRLSFLLNVPFFGQANTRVSVAVLRMQKGCEVVVSQEGVAEEIAAQTEAGWKAMLDTMESVLAREDADTTTQEEAVSGEGS